MLCLVILTKQKTVNSVLNILSNYFLPHIGELNFEEKALYLGYMVKRLLLVFTKEEKATAVAKSVTKAKSDFLAFTAHEIRSPLGFIQTGSEIMKKELWGKLPPKYKKYAEGIHKNSNLILDFINDILDENQIIEGKFKTINALTEIPKVIDEAIKLSNARFTKRKINIEKEIEENLPLLICDERRILQVFINLISNSINHN